MHACLNPLGNHPVRVHGPFCPDPTCGFLQAGTVIERWRIKELLRRSEVADLYLAAPVGDGGDKGARTLVKVLRAALPEGSLSHERLLRLKHAHIQAYLHIGWLGEPVGRQVFVVNYEPSGALARYLKRTTLLPPPTIAGLVSQLADALQFAHEQRILHGRLKPENCLLVGPNLVRISDWYRPFLPREAQMTFSPYMAPEQLQGEIEAASDQYALALIVYQLLGGPLPFAEASWEESMAARWKADPYTLTDLRPDLPRQLDPLLRRALSFDPRERFPNIQTFARVLRMLLESRISGKMARDVPLQQPTLEARTDFVAALTGVPRKTHPRSVAQLCRLPGHTSIVRFLHWAPDGLHLASAASDQHIRIWRVQHGIGSPLTMLEGQRDRVNGLCWSPDGLSLASAGSDATLRIWNMQAPSAPKLERAWWGHDGSVTALDWSPNGLHLASGGVDRTLRLWNQRGEPLTAWQAHGRGGITALAWSPDSQMLATGGTDRLIHLWDALTGACLATCKGSGDEIRHLAWSSDSTLLASATGKRDPHVNLWQPRSGALRAQLSGHSGELAGVCWPGGASTWLVSAAGDCTLRFWNAHLQPASEITHPFPLAHAPISLAGTPVTNLLALSTDDMQITILRIGTRILE